MNAPPRIVSRSIAGYAVLAAATAWYYAAPPGHEDIAPTVIVAAASPILGYVVGQRWALLVPWVVMFPVAMIAASLWSDGAGFEALGAAGVIYYLAPAVTVLLGLGILTKELVLRGRPPRALPRETVNADQGGEVSAIDAGIRANGTRLAAGAFVASLIAFAAGPGGVGGSAGGYAQATVTLLALPVALTLSYYADREIRKAGEGPRWLVALALLAVVLTIAFVFD